MSQLTTQEIEHLKLLLRQRRHELSDAVSGAPGRDEEDFDESNLGRLSRMDALQSHAMQEEARRRRALELSRIDRALQRIEQGEFGVCARCGEDIAPGRLRADPANPVCIRCAD